MPAPAQLSDVTIAAALRGLTPPVTGIAVFTAETDPNKLLGRPGQYTGKVSWNDPRVSNAGDLATIEMFTDEASLQTRFTYLDGITKNGPLFLQWMYSHGAQRLIMRLPKDLTPAQAAIYAEWFMALPTVRTSATPAETPTVAPTVVAVAATQAPTLHPATPAPTPVPAGAPTPAPTIAPTPPAPRPVVTSVVTLSSTSFRIRFSAVMMVAGEPPAGTSLERRAAWSMSLTNPANIYSLTRVECRADDDARSVTCRAALPVPPGTQDTVFVQNVGDAAGNVIEPNVTRVPLTW